LGPTDTLMNRPSPPYFVCYRRADEPFAAAMTASLLGNLVGDDNVFLDTLYLRQRGAFEDDLLTAVRNCDLVLAIIGAAWDSPNNLRRLADPTDWVRRELMEAIENHLPIVPVLVGRDDAPSPRGLNLKFDNDRALLLDRADVDRLERDLSELVGTTASEHHDRRQRVERATLALLRHVLPRPQQSMRNDETIARCVASELAAEDWLRFVAAGNLPGKPNGSALLYLTRAEIGVAQLTEDLASHRVMRLPVSNLTVERADRRRLWKPVTDLHLASGARSFTVQGLFEEEADELLELLQPIN
jgi:TIR domain